MTPEGGLRWDEVEALLDGILGRQYYTNHGPLAGKLEAALCQRFRAGNAVLATNPAIGLIMLLEALKLAGPVLVSASAPAWHENAVGWAGLEAWRCDGGETGAAVLAAAEAGCAGAVFNAGDEIGAFAEDAGLATVCVGWPGSARSPTLVRLPGLRDGPVAACILTGDDMLAGRLRNIRSSYGAGEPVTVARTANGRVSEAQAGLALAQLDALPSAGNA